MNHYNLCSENTGGRGRRKWGNVQDINAFSKIGNGKGNGKRVNDLLNYRYAQGVVKQYPVVTAGSRDIRLDEDLQVNRIWTDLEL